MPFKGIILVFLVAFAAAFYCREELFEFLSRWSDDENE